MGQMIVRKLDDDILDRIKQRARLEGISAEQVARNALTQAFRPSREELIRRMDQIRATTKRSSGQEIIDEIRWNRENNLGRTSPGLDE